jgi:septation ring formation regulator EzrA
MANPLNSVASLGRLPERVVEDLAAIADAARRVPAIEETLVSIRPAIGAAVSEARAIRETVEPQQERVAHIEDMVEEMSGRIATVEEALGQLLAVAEKAVELLPDSDQRGPLTKAREVITGE